MDYQALYHALKGYGKKVNFDYEEVLKPLDYEDEEQFREEIYEYCEMKVRSSWIVEPIPLVYNIFRGKDIEQIKTMPIMVLQSLVYLYLIQKNVKLQYKDF